MFIRTGENFGKTEKRKNQSEILSDLKNLLKGISESINASAKNDFGTEGDLVDANCSLAESFLEVDEDDLEEIGDREKEWSSTFELDKEMDDGKRLELWKANKETSKANITEMLITALLNKFIGDDFIVVRASRFDDYFNGVDNVIVNKKTGEVVCAFDEIREHHRSGRLADKIERAKSLTRKFGGTRVKYGITIKDGKVERARFNGVPVFVLSLAEDIYEKLAQGFNYDSSTEYSETEKEVFGSLMDLVNGQIPDLLAILEGERSPAHVNALNTLKSFQKSFEMMQAKISV